MARPSAVALVVAGAFFMENLDATVIVTALPQMAASFGVRPVDLNIGVSAYVLTLAVLIPASGWLADRFGARTVFSAAIAVFTAASVLCGMADSLPAFVAARILQGAGGAMMVPVGRLAVLRSASKAELLRAVATITWPGLAAPVLGPPVGGFITTYASWRWIFYLNVPLGLIAFALALWLVPDARSGERRPFDLLGFILTGGACFGVMFGVEDLTAADAKPLVASVWLLGGLLVGVVAIRHARRQAHPLLDLSALRYRTYGAAVIGGGFFRVCIASIPFLLPLMLQLGFGYDPFTSGLLVLAVFAGNLGMKPLTTPVLRRFGFRRTLLVNGVIVIVTTAVCALLGPGTPLPLMAALLFASGLARSMQFTSFGTIAFAEVPKERMAGANTLFNMLQQIAFGAGIAAGALGLRIAEAVRGTERPGLPEFHIAFLLVSLLAVIGFVHLWRLPPDAGAEISGHAGKRPA